MDGKEIVGMTHKGILKMARQERKLTQEALANRMDMKRNSMCQNLSRPRISLDMFTRILSAMDYDVMIVDRKTGEAKWKLDVRTIDEIFEDM